MPQRPPLFLLKLKVISQIFLFMDYALEMPVVDLFRLHFNILRYRNLINAVPFFRAICHWLFVRVQIRLADRLTMWRYTRGRNDKTSCRLKKEVMRRAKTLDPCCLADNQICITYMTFLTANWRRAHQRNIQHHFSSYAQLINQAPHRNHIFHHYNLYNKKKKKSQISHLQKRIFFNLKIL